MKKIKDKESEQYSYGNDYDIVDNFKKFTDNHNVCLLVVHHTRKQLAEDAFDSISGSNGLLGAADGAFIMQKIKRIKGKAILDITGRDQADQKLHLEFNQDTFLWNMTKAENKILAPPPDEVLEKISVLLTLENPLWTGAASDLLPLLGEVDLQPNTLTRKLNVNAERLLNEYNIRYENSRTRQGSYIKLILLDMTPCDDVTVI